MKRQVIRTPRFASFAPLGLAAVVALGALGTAACDKQTQEKAEKTAEKAGEAAERAAEKVGKAAEKAGDKIGKAAEKLGEKAEKFGESMEPQAEAAARATRDAAVRGAAAAAGAGSNAAVSAAGALRTGAVKAALLQDSSIDVSDVNVDTDQVARRITLKGRVRSAAVREKVVDIARDTAPGYTIDNELTIQ